MNFLKHFWFASLVSILAVMLSGILLGPSALAIVIVLSVLEITFSFDNAVVNAKVLGNLSKFWQEIFLSVGIIIAVFGMRIIFPIALVDMTSSLHFGEVINLALRAPEEYAHHLEHAMPSIAAFGGAFLAMVFLSYFVLENTGRLWLGRLERALRRLPKHIWTVALIVSLIVAAVAFFVAKPQDTTRVLIAGLSGVILHTVIHLAVSWLEKRNQHEMDIQKSKLTGIAAFTSFLYLEVLDASFSLDGVIGAFAISSSVVVIAIGLGIGAIWVRSMTIALVQHDTLARFSYLSQGAHWAIGILACVLLASVSYHIPETITGFVGVSFIGASIISSLRAAGKHEAVRSTE